MDIYEYLKLDHDHVDKLFKQFEKSQLLERKKQIMSLIADELFVHAHAEQDTFYEALKQHSSSKEEAVHGKKEHREIEAQINRIMHSHDFGATWVKKVDKLKEIVQHHVRDEEGKMFRQAKKVFSKTEACDLKEQMHYLKQQLVMALHKKEAEKVTQKKVVSQSKKAAALHKIHMSKKGKGHSAAYH